MKNLNLPDFYNIIETKHYIFGRVRYNISKLKSSDEFRQILTENLKEFNFIKSFKISSVTGSLLIYFDESILDVGVLTALIIRILDLEKEIEKERVGVITLGNKQILKIINNSIYNKTKGMLDLKMTLSILFIIFGVRKIVANPSLPNGVNLLWWSFSLMKGGKDVK